MTKRKNNKNKVSNTRINFKVIFDKWDADNQKTWEFNRDDSAGASEVFDCWRKLFYTKNGYDKDSSYKYSWGAFARGNLLEDEYVVPAMYNAIDSGMFGKDVALIGAGEDQKTFVEGNLSATPDGLLIGLAKDALKDYGIDDIESDCVVFEIKSIDPRVSLTEEKEVHHGQVQVQMGIIRESTDFKPKYAVILYVDCSFFDEMQIYIVEYTEKMYDYAKQRADLVFAKDAKAENFRAEGRIDGTCDFCDYREACMETIRGSIPDGEDEDDLTEEDKELLDSLVMKSSKCQIDFKAAEKAHKEAKADLSEILKEHGRKALRDPKYSVTITWNKGRKSLDKEALNDDMEEAGLNMDDYYTTGLGFETVRVTMKKQKT